MKYCSNCHRFSKDDDFCSNCGSAVYDDNSENSIDCSQIPGHTHEKQTFSGSGSYESNLDIPQSRPAAEQKSKKKGSGCVSIFIIFIIVSVVIDMISGSHEVFFEVLEMLFELIST
ncbi:MAG: hypothetical protein MSJ26_04805 [Oscillospiraceae bacterium]|nr:hypothetical protein [Oscillospiraceae bacterium]